MRAAVDKASSGRRGRALQFCYVNVRDVQPYVCLPNRRVIKSCAKTYARAKLEFSLRAAGRIHKRVSQFVPIRDELSQLVPADLARPRRAASEI